MSDAHKPWHVEFDPETTPKIILAGREWLCPKMGVNQIVIIAPLAIKGQPILVQINEDAKIRDADGKETDRVNLLLVLKLMIERGIYLDLCTICYTALTRAYPDMTREDFDNMPVDWIEMTASFSTIAKAAGVIREGKKAD